MKDHYVMDENHNVRAVDWEEWVEWSKPAYSSKDGFEKLRRVAFTVVDSDCNVSTVFLGVDHDFSMNGPPILFETMVFGGEFDQEQERYATWDEAVVGHAAIVAKVMGTA